MRIEIARNVIEHLRKFPFGFPSSSTNEEWKLFEYPLSLTDEEGELLSRMVPYSEHVDDIAKRLGRRKSDILPLLDGLVHKTWVLRTGSKEDGRYTAQTFGPGASELQMPWVGTEMMEKIGNIGLKSEQDPASVIPYFRVIPREAALSNTAEVLPSEMVSHIIEQAKDDELAVTECICRKTSRLMGKACSAPVEDQCLFLGAFAVTIVELNAGRRVTKTEAHQKIKRAQELGLVHQSSANAHPLVICSCCTCCCASLKTFVSSPQPFSLKANFYSELNNEVCKGTCPECVKICPVKAWTIDKKKQRPVVDASKCIGCGLCAAACPEKAIALERKEKPYVYPNTWDDYLRLRLRQTGRDKFFK